jgi:hypothetical protein
LVLLMRGILKSAVEIASDYMVCIPSFIKIGPAIQKLIEGHTHTHRQQGDLIIRKAG